MAGTVLGRRLAINFFRLITAAFLPVVLLGACAHQSVTKPIDLKTLDSRTAIIFIHGYYGSALADDSGQRVFITAGQTLFGHKHLSLYNKELENPPAPHLNVEGVMRNVPLIPFVSIDVYGDFLDRLQTMADKRNEQVIAFAYDWRDDLTVSAAKLDALIDALHAKGVRHISLLAHSMGCLLTAYELGYGGQPLSEAQLDWRGAKKVDAVVFMAGPFDGVFSIFRNMQRGAILAGNSSLLPRDTVSSFPASYQLLPFRRAHLLTYDGKQIAMPMREPAYWRRHDFSLLADQKLTPAVRTRREKFTDAQVAGAVRFTDLIHFEGAHAPDSLRVMNLFGHGHKTTETGYYDEASGNFMFDLDHLSRKGLKEDPLLGDGDGTVLTTASQLPEALALHATVLGTTVGHAKVFEDSGFMKELEAFLP